MSEPDPLDDGYPGCHPPQWGRGWRAAGRFIDCMEVMIRRAIAQPARSAVATAALGLIVGVAVRTLVVRHSEPGAAAGSINREIPAIPFHRTSGAPANRPTSGAPPLRGKPEALTMPDIDLSPASFETAKPGVDCGPGTFLENGTSGFGDLIDDRVSR